MNTLSLSRTMVDTGTAPVAVPKPTFKDKRRMVKGRDGRKHSTLMTLTLEEYRALEPEEAGESPVSSRSEQVVPGLVTGAEPGGDNSAEVEQLRQRLRGRMDDLTGQEQQALLLHFEGISYRAMAMTLGVSKSKAHRLVRGAMRELRLLT